MKEIPGQTHKVSKIKGKLFKREHWDNYLHLGGWVTGKPSYISSYSINFVSPDKKKWSRVFHLGSAKEVRRFAKYLIESVKIK